MPMVYISKNTWKLLNDLLEHLQQNANVPSRVLKADVLHAALEEYAKKLGVKVK